MTAAAALSNRPSFSPFRTDVPRNTLVFYVASVIFTGLGFLAPSNFAATLLPFQGAALLTAINFISLACILLSFSCIFAPLVAPFVYIKIPCMSQQTQPQPPPKLRITNLDLRDIYSSAHAAVVQHALKSSYDTFLKPYMNLNTQIYREYRSLLNLVNPQIWQRLAIKIPAVNHDERGALTVSYGDQVPDYARFFIYLINHLLVLQKEDSLLLIKKNALRLGETFTPAPPKEFICGICLEEGKNEQIERFQTECGHLFCSTCIDPWLQQEMTCPTCRQQIVGNQLLFPSNFSSLLSKLFSNPLKAEKIIATQILTRDKSKLIVLISPFFLVFSQKTTELLMQYNTLAQASRDIEPYYKALLTEYGLSIPACPPVYPLKLTTTRPTLNRTIFRPDFSPAAEGFPLLTHLC